MKTIAGIVIFQAAAPGVFGEVVANGIVDAERFTPFSNWTPSRFFDSQLDSVWTDVKCQVPVNESMIACREACANCHRCRGVVVKHDRPGCFFTHRDLDHEGAVFPGRTYYRKEDRGTWFDSVDKPRHPCHCSEGSVWHRILHHSYAIKQAIADEDADRVIEIASHSDVGCPPQGGMRLYPDNTHCMVGRLMFAFMCTAKHFYSGAVSMAGIWFDSLMDTLLLCHDCLDDSEWPLTKAEIHMNYMSFQERFYSSALHYDPAGCDAETTPQSLCEQPRLKWQTLPQHVGLRCPAPLPVTQKWMPPPQASDPRVSCLIPTLWPAEKELMKVQVETFGRDCHRMAFFIASKEKDVPKSFMGQEIVNLIDFFPYMLPDRGSEGKEMRSSNEDGHLSYVSAVSNTIHKVLHMYMYAERVFHYDPWLCRLDTDTYFVPRNFHRLVRDLDPDDKHYLGNRMYFHKNMAPGVIFAFGGGGVCLSRGAVSALGDTLINSHYTTHEGHWNSNECQFGPGHWDDVKYAFL